MGPARGSAGFAGLAAAAGCAVVAAGLPLRGLAALAAVGLGLAAVGLSYRGTAALVPVVMRFSERKGLYGYDINKKGTQAGEVKVPEALGLAVGLVYLVAVIAIQQVHVGLVGAAAGPPAEEQGWRRFLGVEKPGVHYEVGKLKLMLNYDVSLGSICFMLFLGFADDVLDIPWRTKLMLPTVATLPLLAAYTGGTAILLPKFVQGLLGFRLLELGVLYKLYMLLFVVFSTNSINILAGLNGLEAGQTLVVACAVLLFNLQQVARHALAGPEGPTGVDPHDPHLFSACLMLPLIGTTLGLLKFNWFPSQCFVGDTFTYFAGMVLAVAGIMGHFSETLLVFMLPQVLNFVYSTPQLFKLVPCPRHRLPTFDVQTGLLHPKPRTDGGPNLNLVNLFLRLFGPATEETLCLRLLAFQALCCCAGFAAHLLMEGGWK